MSDDTDFAFACVETEREFENALVDVLYHEADDIRTFEEAGVLTHNRGLVVRLADGSEFHVTIVQSKSAR